MSSSKKLDGENLPRSPQWAALASGISCLFLALVLQWTNGAWHADLAGDPDEAAHAVTSLMVRDYLTDAAPRNPLAYAQEYYKHFPKVALGHYPPVYYLVSSAALLASPRISTLIVLQSVFCGILGWQIFQLGRRFTGSFGAWLAGVVFVALPMVQKVSSCVMSDLLLACWCLGAALVWIAYMRRPSGWSSLLFGLMAAAAILTKGAGLLLAVVPPVSILLAGEFRLLKKWSFWLAPLPVMVLAAPWMVYSIRFTQEGMADDSGMAYALKAIPFYAKGIWSVFGPLIAVLAGASLLRVLSGLFVRRPVTRESAVLWGLIGGTLAVAILVPAGLSTRYLVPAGGAFIMLAFVECRYWVRFVQSRVRRAAGAGLDWGGVIGVGCVAGITLAVVGGLAPKVASGFDYAVARLELEVEKEVGSSASQVWMVSSDARGEGAVIAVVVFKLPSRKNWPLTVLRASKELASSDWMGRGYETQFKTPEELRQRLDELKVGAVLADESVPSTHVQTHHGKLVEALSGSVDWRLMKVIDVKREQGHEGQIKLFCRIRAIRASAPPEPAPRS